jgi:putative ATP-dependent endonuclease of OLD family
MAGLSDKVLNTAKRFGKARFAQVLSKHINLAEEMPDYIRNAVDWLEL